jgi:hypothetical protein
LTHVSDGICNGGFGASAGFDIWGSFCFDMPSVVDSAPEQFFATAGADVAWLVAVAHVLGVGTVLVISIEVKPEAGEGDFFFSGTSLLPNGDCNLPATLAALAGILATSVRRKFGASLGSTCCCAEG